MTPEWGYTYFTGNSELQDDALVEKFRENLAPPTEGEDQPPVRVQLLQAPMDEEAMIAVGTIIMQANQAYEKAATQTADIRRVCKALIGHDGRH